MLLVEMVRLILMGSCARLTEWPVGCAYLLIHARRHGVWISCFEFTAI